MAALRVILRANTSRHHPPIYTVTSVVCVQHREASNVVKGQAENLAAYKRGKGGRASFSGLVATVFGATGFLGRYVVNRLGKIGSQIIIPYRADPYHVKELKVAGELGQVLFQPYYLRDDASIRSAMQYSNVVINLVGRDWETKNFTFDDVHVEGSRRIARIARECGVEQFVHLTHLNAQPTPPAFCVKGGSKYLISKFRGEEAVREEFPNATIFRCADVYGPADRYLNYYASPWRRARGCVPLYKRGEATIKRPVFCSDVAEGVINALQDPAAVGNTYEIYGPHKYYLSELVDYFYRVMRWPGHIRTFVTPLFKMKVRLISLAPAYPVCTLDKLDREHVSDNIEGLPTLKDLGVRSLMRIEDRALVELRHFRKHNYYEEKVGEFPDPAPPAPII